MKAEEMLALVGGDVALSRDNSGASVFNGMSFGSLGGSRGPATLDAAFERFDVDKRGMLSMKMESTKPLTST